MKGSCERTPSFPLPLGFRGRAATRRLDALGIFVCQMCHSGATVRVARGTSRVGSAVLRKMERRSLLNLDELELVDEIAFRLTPQGLRAVGEIAWDPEPHFVARDHLREGFAPTG